jgi:phytol kinase
MPMSASWTGIAVVLTTYAALLAIFSMIGSRLPPEVLRKSLHVTMGLTALSFPWLFASAWPVLFIGAAATLAFIAVRVHVPFVRPLASALERVPRVSVGEFCFVAGTCMVFVLAGDDPLLYVIPMLLLTLADAAAALVGTAYGRHRYAAMGYYKTIEGSVTFFAVACPCIYLPLALYTPASHFDALAIAVLVALAVTVLEAAMGHGFDNLAVPLGAFAAIKATGLTDEQPHALESGAAIVYAGMCLAAALLVLLVVILFSWRRAERMHAMSANADAKRQR